MSGRDSGWATLRTGPLQPVMYPPVDRSAPLPPAPIDHHALNRPQCPPPPVTPPMATVASVLPEPMLREQALREPVLPEPVTAVPALREPVLPEPVTAVPVVPEPVLPEPVTAVPVLPEPVTAVPVTAVPVTAIIFPVPPPRVHTVPPRVHTVPPRVHTVPPRVVVPASIAPPQPPAGTGHPGGTGGYLTVPPVRPVIDNPPARSGVPIGVLVLGVLIGFLVFGATGYVVGSRAGGSTVDAAAGESREAANRRRVGPVLATLAEGWVPWLGGCLSNSEAGGPAPYPGEQSRVACVVDTGVDMFFVRFASAADRAAARAVKETWNANSATLAAGAAPAVAQRAGTSGRTTGAYIEFAYQRQGRTYGGIWWEDSGTTGAAYIEKVWTAVDGGWRPLRDLWQRHT